MKRLVFFVFAIFMFVEAMAQNYSEDLTKELERHFMVSDLPGFSVSIVNQDGVLYEKAFGLADKTNRIDFKTSTIQNLGSVSKTVVGLALVKAIEEGKLSMDTEINELLPFEVTNPYFKDSPILVRHLANHTSSILDTDHYRKSYILDDSYIETEDVHKEFLEFIQKHEPMDLKEFLFNILNKEGDWYSKRNFLKAEPGSKKDYANLNAALAAYIIEVATAMPFEEFTQSRIFTPLGMKFTSWNRSKDNWLMTATPYFPVGDEVPRYKLITYPDGGLYSNVEDLSKYLIEMIKAYSGNSTYLEPKYAQILLPGDDDSDRAFWGMGEKSRNIGHGGSDPGAQADLQFNADRRIGRIILSNVNAEDNEKLWQQYREIHGILGKYEDALAK